MPRTTSATAWSRCSPGSQGLDLKEASIADLEITWPDESRQELRGLPVNRLVKVRQGEEARLLAFD